MSTLAAALERRWVWVFSGLVVLAIAIRLLVVGVPAVRDQLPFRPYSRSLHYQDAAEAVLRGEAPIVHPERVSRAADRWRESGSFLPPDLETEPLSASDEALPFYDERGYLLVTLGVARITGRVAFLDLLLLQAVISTAVVALVTETVHRVWSASAAVGAGLVFALHPLDLALVAMPDLPVWAVWATAIAGSLVLLGNRAAWPLAWFGGAFVGFSIVLRAPTAAVAVAMLVALVVAHGRAGLRSAFLALGGVVAGLVGPSLVPVDVPAIGRSAFWHTLLGGLGEFGDIEGLRWHDRAIYAFVNERHGVTFGEPGFSEAARAEYLEQVSARPWLPIWVIVERFGWFLIAYRPGKEGLFWVLSVGIVKVAGAVATGVVLWWGGSRERRLVIAIVGLILAPLAAHALIVPLLEVYVAPTLVGLSVLAGAVAAGSVIRPATPTPEPPVRGLHA